MMRGSILPGAVALALHLVAVVVFALLLDGYSHREFPLALLGAQGVPRALAFNLCAFVLPGMLATIAICCNQEVALVIVGGVFVMEAMSVILQVASFKLRGKRIFRMSPIHHHFELKGWKESQVIIRFWILSIIFALIGLATLKLR